MNIFECDTPGRPGVFLYSDKNVRKIRRLAVHLIYKEVKFNGKSRIETTSRRRD